MKITSQCEKWTCKRSLVPYHRWALSSASSGRGNATQHLKDEASRPSNTRTEISCWNLSRNASADPLVWCVLAVSTFVHTNIWHSLHMIQRSRKFLALTAQIIHRRHREQHVGNVQARPPARKCAFVSLTNSNSYAVICMATSRSTRRAVRSATIFFRGPSEGGAWAGTPTSCGRKGI